MELTTKGRYAVMALAHIARHGNDTAVPLSAIAEQQSLPLPYLEQLFLALRRAGVVVSARGRSGGYRLAHAARDISIADVMAAVSEDTTFTLCDGDAQGCRKAGPCITHDLWQALSEVTSTFLADVNLEHIASGQIPSPRRPRPVRGTTDRIYLDHNATAPLRPEARAAMIAALDGVGNPSSVHQDGRHARGILERAREQVAKLTGAKPSEVVFTSGASEANAWLIGQPWSRIFAADIEHDSVRAAVAAHAGDHLVLPTSPTGIIDVVRLAEAVLLEPEVDAGGATLVTVQLANNETGVCQPVADVAAFARTHGLLTHTDAVQAPGRLKLDFTALNVDFLSLSAHKFGGPKGIGALIIRDGIDLVSLLKGGGQERRRRAGTENLAAIAGFGAAAEAVIAAGDAEVAHQSALRDRLEHEILAVAPQTWIAGKNQPRLCNTTTLAVAGQLAETLVIKLDLRGISVSAGSACSSGKVGASHVLKAMGVDDAIAGGAIRVSIGPTTTDDDITAFVAAWTDITRQSAMAA